MSGNMKLRYTLYLIYAIYCFPEYKRWKTWNDILCFAKRMFLERQYFQSRKFIAIESLDDSILSESIIVPWEYTVYRWFKCFFQFMYLSYQLLSFLTLKILRFYLNDVFHSFRLPPIFFVNYAFLNVRTIQNVKRKAKTLVLHNNK